MKTWNLRWFHETRKSNKLKPEVSAPGWALGPSQELNTSGFNFLIFEFREYHLRFSSFSCPNSREYHQKFTNKSMKSRSQNKKNMRGFSWNTVLVIFMPNYSDYWLHIEAYIVFSLNIFLQRLFVTYNSLLSFLLNIMFCHNIVILVLYWLLNNAWLLPC